MGGGAATSLPTVTLAGVIMEEKEVTGFVMVSCALIQELGLSTAAIAGGIWGFSQMATGVCFASHSTIAKRLRISIRTVSRSMKILRAAHYIEDLTPNVNGTTHLYKPCDILNTLLSSGGKSQVYYTREQYREYLQTPGWKLRRGRAMRSAEYKCRICNTNYTLNVHHRTYERLGHEHDADLIVLCKECHKLFHGIEEQEEYIDDGLRSAENMAAAMVMGN